MWWSDLLWGLWNGFTAWIVFIVHVFGTWDKISVIQSRQKNQVHMGSGIVGKLTAQVVTGGPGIAYCITKPSPANG